MGRLLAVRGENHREIYGQLEKLAIRLLAKLHPW